MARCWECESTVERTVEVTLSSLGHNAGTIRLCEACYQRYYLPLLEQFGAETTASDIVKRDNGAADD